jgi:hypothetical protein
VAGLVNTLEQHQGSGVVTASTNGIGQACFAIVAAFDSVVLDYDRQVCSGGGSARLDCRLSTSGACRRSKLKMAYVWQSPIRLQGRNPCSRPGTRVEGGGQRHWAASDRALRSTAAVAGRRSLYPKVFCRHFVFRIGSWKRPPPSSPYPLSEEVDMLAIDRIGNVQTDLP